MKIRLLLAFVGLAIGLAAPTLAQQKDTIDSQIDEQVTKKMDEGFNNGDAAAVGALFTEDAVFVTPQGPIFGREAIEKLFEGMFQTFESSRHRPRASKSHGLYPRSKGETLFCRCGSALCATMLDTGRVLSLTT